MNAMTVDVEEYFTVENLSRRVPREEWSKLPMRADHQTRELLDLFDRHRVKGTFFLLGWVAERLPGLVKEIFARGHEVAAHSYFHQLVYKLTPDEFRADVQRTKSLLEDMISAKVVGYRAPTYSITKATPWAHEILAEVGFTYSSSVFPILHDRYGIPDHPRFPIKHEFGGRQITEFPLTTLRTGGKNLPIAGGGYLRLLPVSWVARAIKRVNEREHQPGIVYMHPWEIDPEIPRFRQGVLKDFRGYVGLDRMLGKLDYLLGALPFGRVDEVLGGLG